VREACEKLRPGELVLTGDLLLDAADHDPGLRAWSSQELEALKGDPFSALVWAPVGDGMGSCGESTSGSASDLGLFCRVLQGFLLRADFITKLLTALSGFAFTPWLVESMNMNCIGFFPDLRLPLALGLLPLASMVHVHLDPRGECWSLLGASEGR
jgi:hypothetical protein